MSWYGGNWNISKDFVCSICGRTSSSFSYKIDGICHWCKKEGWKTKEERQISIQKAIEDELSTLSMDEKSDMLSKLL